MMRAHFVAIILTVVSSAMFLLDPLVIKWLIDVVLPRRDIRLLVLGAGAFLAIYVCRLAASVTGGFLSFRTVEKLVFGIRLRLLKQINRLSAEFHESTSVGEKLFRLERDVDEVAEVGAEFVPYLLRTVFNCCFVAVTMCVLNFRLTCVLLPLIPLFFAIKKHLRAKLRSASELAQRQSSCESSFLQEHLLALLQIQLLRRECSQTRVFAHLSAARVRALCQRKLTELAFSTSYMLTMLAATLVILTYGGHLVFLGLLTTGGFVAFYSYLVRLFDPVNAAVEIYARLNRVSTSIGRIMEINELEPSVQLRSSAKPFAGPLKGHVTFNGVYFRYRTGPSILSNLNLEIGAGEKVAIVGASGSGKSTVAKLIARLYDVDRGSVEIDGRDVKDIRIESLRTRVCYVPQETVLFDRTMKMNLLLANPDATSDELCRAIEIAELSQVVARLPEGLDGSLGPRGNKLSGGEQQRVALARLILRRPQLIVLDEATSALDMLTEERILRRFRELYNSMTMIFISHRIAALRWADRIVVLESGEVREQGSHDRLIQGIGPYASLCAHMASVLSDSAGIPSDTFAHGLSLPRAAD